MYSSQEKSIRSRNRAQQKNPQVNYELVWREKSYITPVYLIIATGKIAMIGKKEKEDEANREKKTFAKWNWKMMKIFTKNGFLVINGYKIHYICLYKYAYLVEERQKKKNPCCHRRDNSFNFQQQPNVYTNG